MQQMFPFCPDPYQGFHVFWKVLETESFGIVFVKFPVLVSPGNLSARSSKVLEKSWIFWNRESGNTGYTADEVQHNFVEGKDDSSFVALLHNIGPHVATFLTSKRFQFVSHVAGYKTCLNLTVQDCGNRN